MGREINSVAVLGAGTMGAGIAGLCAEKDCKVLMLDVSRDAAEKALDRIVNGRPPAIDTPGKEANIEIGSLDEDLHRIADCDWICEAVIEDLATKQALFERIEAARSDGSIVSTNTSGIKLSAITENAPERLRRDVCVTHFFNPVKIMKLCELVPGTDTAPDVVDSLADFLQNNLGKGVVNAKDTVNFIGNRIGCFWMLMGLHGAGTALSRGLTQEAVDAQLSKPMGIPPTGLYGLIDLIGLDIMDLVGKNLADNLPDGDVGLNYTRFPSPEQAMLERGQLGRKTGGGFYRMLKLDDGSRKKEVFDLITGDWRDEKPSEVDEAHATPAAMFQDDPQGELAWTIMGGTLCYAADLVGEISDDIVAIDNAMKWGFAWNKGPFELIDDVGADRFIAKLRDEGQALPRMFQILDDAGAESFYRNGGTEFLGLDGNYHPT